MTTKKANNPLAEVFGFPIDNTSERAKRYRDQKLCPFNNRVPNCTKDKANAPLGVCSVNQNSKQGITCPIRFREDWIIAENAASFFFTKSEKWTSLTELKLLDKDGESAGNVDYVLVSYDEKGRLTDFGSLEVQAVYITGNLRNPFNAYMEKPTASFEWETGYNYPKPDYLSSSRKRLVPQMLYKGGIFKAWNKKQAVALQKSFFETLPKMPRVKIEDADIAWFLYDLVFDKNSKRFILTLDEIVYTDFQDALLKITTPNPGEVEKFMKLLQGKLDERLEGNPPDAPTLNDIVSR